jgi:hypothetical protein
VCIPPRLFTTSLLALVGILAVSNLGTSFAAASFAKDTTTSSNAELTDKHTHQALSTQSAVESIEIERTRITPDGGRKLCTAGGSDIDCETESSLTISNTQCYDMISHCSRGNTVDLKRTWKNGDVSFFNVCPFKSGTISKTSKSKLRNSVGKSFFFQDLIAHCSVDGDAVAQELGEICEVSGDCASLNCARNTTRIDDCRDNCENLRFSASRLPLCKSNCDYPTCHPSPLSAF